MEKLTRRRYTLESKQEAVRLVTSGQRVSAAAKALGIVEQTLANWVKAEKAGRGAGPVQPPHRGLGDGCGHRRSAGLPRAGDGLAATIPQQGPDLP